MLTLKFYQNDILRVPRWDGIYSPRGLRHQVTIAGRSQDYLALAVKPLNFTVMEKLITVLKIAIALWLPFLFLMALSIGSLGEFSYYEMVRSNVFEVILIVYYLLFFPLVLAYFFSE